jgi:hypothetical protein
MLQCRGFQGPCGALSPTIGQPRRGFATVFFLALGFIALSWLATIRGRDAWPFSGYPMFSRPVRPEQIRVYRIWLEYPDGSTRWWRPHYYKLQQTFGLDFKRATGLPLPDRIDLLHNLRLRIERCLKQDPAAAGATSYCVVLRRPVLDPDGTWKPVDEVVQRTVLDSYDSG